MAAKKASGARLGNPRNIDLAGAAGRKVQTNAADKFAASLFPVLQAIRGTGATTLAAMSAALNERGIRPARGTRWHVSSVMNLLSRANKFTEAR